MRLALLLAVALVLAVPATALAGTAVITETVNTAGGRAATLTFGDDVLRGGQGSDTFIGDGDSPTSADPGGGSDLMDGGAGADGVSYAGRTTPVRVDLDVGLAPGPLGEIDRLNGIESVDGGRGADELVGDNAPNGIDGGRGDDAIDGRGGNDQLRDGLGSDTLLGGTGSDDLAGGQAGDALYGGAGDDTLSNLAGTSPLSARVVNCGSGRDTVLTPQGQLIAGCELIRLADLHAQPLRRLRDGRLRTRLECRDGLRCEVVIKVRRGSAVLARRSVTVRFAHPRTIDLRPRARVRAGQTVDVTIAGRQVISDAAPGPLTTPPIAFAGRWRMRL